MPHSIKIGVILLHFGSITDTVECIRSLEQTLIKNIELVVYLVDNDPKNRLNNTSASSTLKVILLQTSSNLGFAGGINTGVKSALKDRCDYILLLNNDIVVDRLVFKNLLPYFNNHVRLISPLITYYKNRNIIWCTHG